MLWNEHLVTVVILSYQNQEQLKPTLESVLKQNYARLEIILADDSSDDFDVNDWDNWIRKKKQNNIENIIVMRNDINLGTVKNLRRALSVMNGAYYMTLSSGDVFYTNEAISILMMYAFKNDHRELVIMGQAVHCDKEYQIKNHILSESDYAILRERDTREFFSRLIHRCCVTAVSSMHRKDFPELVDAYDTAYKYYEDYPSYLRMARKGFTPLFVEKVITLHVLGGIANNADSFSKEAIQDFHEDRELLYRKDIRPYLEGQPKSIIHKLKMRRETLQYQYLWALWRRSTDKQHVFMILQHPWTFYFGLRKGLRTIERIFRLEIFSLLLLSLLKSSNLLSGIFGMLTVNLLLAVCAFGAASQTIYRAYGLFFETRRLWRKAVAGDD